MCQVFNHTFYICSRIYRPVFIHVQLKFGEITTFESIVREYNVTERTSRSSQLSGYLPFRELVHCASKPEAINMSTTEIQ